jgi:hypothetical protein
MLKLHTAVLIDLITHTSLDLKIYNRQAHYKWYCEVAEYLKRIIEITDIENIVYASYGSRNETTDVCTDIVFKNTNMFPNHLNKVSGYSAYSHEEYFNNKNILLVGYSFYNCIAQRELGFSNLIKNPAIGGVYCSPPLTGYYGVGPGVTPESEFEIHKQPIGVTKATDRDFENDCRVRWERKELADIYRVFKCEPINS